MSITSIQTILHPVVMDELIQRPHVGVKEKAPNPAAPYIVVANGKSSPSLSPLTEIKPEGRR